MDILRLSILNMVLFVLLFIPAQPANLQAEISGKPHFEELTLELSTTKKEYKLLEPIPILMTLANRTERVVMGHSALDFGYNYVDVYVKDDRNQMQKIDQLSTETKLVIAEPQAMKPNSEFRASLLLSLGLDHIFPEPGTYQIVARLYDLDRKKSVTSKPVTIRVVFPSGVDFQAFEYIKTYGNPSYFFTGMRLARNVQVLETFVSAFGESAYGDYATFSIAEFHFANRDYEKARPYFEKLAAKRAFVFSEKASDYVEKIKTPNQP